MIPCCTPVFLFMSNSVLITSWMRALVTVKSWMLNVTNIILHLKMRKPSHLVVELRALVVVQDGCVGAAGEEWVSRLAVDALEGKETNIDHQIVALWCRVPHSDRWAGGRSSVTTGWERVSLICMDLRSSNRLNKELRNQRGEPEMIRSMASD